MQLVHWVDPDWETTWGLGFSVLQRDETTWARRGGGCPGDSTEFAVLPERDLGIVVLTTAIGSEVSLYARKAAAVLGPAVKKSTDEKVELPVRESDVDRFVGVYDSEWGRNAIVRRKNALAAVWLASRAIDPDDWIVALQHVEGATFRRVRKDDGSLGEEWVFEVDEDGQVISVTSHSFPMQRVP